MTATERAWQMTTDQAWQEKVRRAEAYHREAKAKEAERQNAMIRRILARLPPSQEAGGQ